MKIWTDFPKASNNCINATSPATEEYNCIAWAASDNTYWIWPDEDEVYAWPPNLPRVENLENFVLFFETMGFQHHQSDKFDHKSNEYVALYGTQDAVSHAARSLTNGKWASKLGDAIDVEHVSEKVIENSIYGPVIYYLFRRRGRKPNLPDLQPKPSILKNLFGGPLR